MKIGIEGTGRMASQRARAFTKLTDVAVVAVSSRSAGRAENFIEEHRLDDARATSWNEMIGDDAIDGVVVTGPNGVHESLACGALESGKYLFLEYPPAVMLDGAKKIADTATRVQKCVHVGLTHRYGSGHAVRRALFGAGDPDLGPLVSFQRSICSGNPISRWYDDDGLSGGMFVASLYHYIDESLSLFGDAVSQTGRYWSDRDEDGTITRDRGSVMIEHDSGCVSQITYARGMSKPGIGTRSVGIFRGGYFIEDESGSRIVTESGSETLDRPDEDTMFLDSEAFVSLVASGAISDGTLEASTRSLEVALAVQKSAE